MEQLNNLQGVQNALKEGRLAVRRFKATTSPNDLRAGYKASVLQHLEGWVACCEAILLATHEVDELQLVDQWAQASSSMDVSLATHRAANAMLDAYNAGRAPVTR